MKQENLFELPSVMEIIKSNILKYQNPLALKGTEISKWSKGLHLPTEGDVLLYTGGEYQLIPYIDSLVNTVRRLDQGSKSYSIMIETRNLIDRIGIAPEKYFSSIFAKNRNRYSLISFKAAMLLKKFGWDICYLGEKEIYSGSLLYEFGYYEELGDYSKYFYELLNKTGAKTLICLSPHSAELLKLVYPKLINNFNFEILTFPEAIFKAVKNNNLEISLNYNKKLTIHDSCRIARELNFTDEIRDLLEILNVKNIVEPLRNKKWTTCCGGPGKMFFPEVSGKVVSKRLKELSDTNAEISLTFCPYCTAALGDRSKALNMEVIDFIEFLYRGVFHEKKS